MAPAPQDAPPDERTRRISLYLGERSLDDDDFEPVEDQGMLGIAFSSEAPGWPLGWEIGLAGSHDDGDFLGFDVEATTLEAYAGPLKTFRAGSRIRPYIGGGASLIYAEVEIESFDDGDASFAGYVHGGVLVDLTAAISLGLDARILFGSDIEIAGEDGDADYHQVAFVLGFGF